MGSPSDKIAPGESDDLFRLLVDAVSDYAIFALDPRGDIITWNAGARILKGYQREEIIGSNFSRFYTPEDVARNHPKHELELALRNGSYSEEGWRVRKDGTRFWASVVITALIDREGVHRGFAKVTRDLTERKQAEDALRSSEERFRLMVEGVKDYAIFMLDPQGNVATWNEGARRNKGYEAHEIIGQHFSKFYPEAEINNGKPAVELKGAVRLGRFEDTGWRVRKDGTQFWANVIITAIHDKQGRLLGFSKVTRDLTERKKAYDELEERVQQRTAELARAKDLAESAVRSRDMFLSIASHELKTPLTSLKLQVQMRKRNVARGRFNDFAPERLAALFADDEKQINRIGRLVDDMLDVARLTAGKLSLERTETELGELVQEVLNRFAPQLEAANIAVAFDAPAKVTGLWDRYRIEQVFTNLLTNAIKYGAGKPIGISVEHDATMARLVVRDHGIGIAPQDHARVFLQFERAVSASSVSGLGLGLYIARQIVEAHGGTISLESALGQGSMFKVKLERSISNGEKHTDSRG